MSKIKMFVFFYMFTFLLCYDSRCNGRPVKPQQLVDNLDLNNLQYPKYQRHHRAPGLLVLPEMIQSISHFIRSYLPTVNKGTDSRLGFGFALGNHADFQVVLELGPQIKTKALETGFQPISSAKRQASMKPKCTKTSKKLLPTDGSIYLQNWARKMRHYIGL